MPTNTCATWTNFAVDGAVLAVICIFAFVSAKKGFVQCLFGFISTLLSLIIAFSLMKSVLTITGGLFGIQGAIENGLIKTFSKVEAFNLDISAVGLAESLTGKLPKFLINAVVDKVGDSTLPVGTTLATVLGATVAEFTATLISFFLTFLIAKLCLKLLERVLSSFVEKLPIVGSLNSVLGLLVGALEGLLVASGVVAVLALFPSQSMASFFSDCIIFKWLYNSNPLHVIFSWFLA